MKNMRVNHPRNNQVLLLNLRRNRWTPKLLPLVFTILFASIGTYTIWYSHAESIFVPPDSIVSDCSKSVDTELNTWLANVPDNSTIKFGSGRCYGQDGTIQLFDRHGITIDGNGSTFKALTLNKPVRSNWQVWAGSNIIIKNMTVYGADPNAGAGHPDTVGGVTYEHQHGYVFSGTNGGILDSVKAYNLYGDGAEAQRDTRTPYREIHPARNITIQNSHFEGTDRVVIGLTSSDGVVVKNNYIGNSNLGGVDIEPNSSYDSASNIQIIDNTIADIRWEAVTLSGNGNESNILIGGNTVPDSVKNVCKAGVRTISQAVPISNLTIDSNHFVTGFAAMRLEGVKQVVVTNNTLQRSSLNACAQYANQRVGVLYGNAQDLTIRNNTFDQAIAVSQVLSGTNSNILACENRLQSTGGFVPTCPNSSPPPPPAPIDITPPTVSITSPTNSQTVKGSSVNIEAVASDNVGVTKVEFYVDGLLKATLNSGPFQWGWNTTATNNGSHTLLVKAYDNAGNNTSSSAISVNVLNSSTSPPPPPAPTPTPAPTPSPTPPPVGPPFAPGDINGDGKVDIFDAAIIANNWGRSGVTRSQGDLNGDGVVNIFDAAIIANNWGR